jgi:hypothetical protein
VKGERSRSRHLYQLPPRTYRPSLIIPVKVPGVAGSALSAPFSMR